MLNDEFLGERFVTVIRLKAYVFDARFEGVPVRSDGAAKHAFRDAGILTPIWSTATWTTVDARPPSPNAAASPAVGPGRAIASRTAALGTEGDVGEPLESGSLHLDGGDALAVGAGAVQTRQCRPTGWHAMSLNAGTTPGLSTST